MEKFPVHETPDLPPPTHRDYENVKLVKTKAESCLFAVDLQVVDWSSSRDPLYDCSISSQNDEENSRENIHRNDFSSSLNFQDFLGLCLIRLENFFPCENTQLV